MSDELTQEGKLIEESGLPFSKPEKALWWEHGATGDLAKDIEVGEMCGRLALAVAKNSDCAFVLAAVIRDMIRGGEFGGMEAGFISTIASAARAGSMD